MSDFPENWASTQLGEVCKVVRGITFPASAKEEKFTSKNVCCLRTTNVQKEVDWDDVYFVSKEYVKRDEQFVKIGDVLMSMANSYELVGKVSVVRELPYLSSFGAFLSAVRPLPVIDAQYLFHVLRTAKVQSELRKGSSQTVNIANISVSRLSEIEIPLAPLDEQKRIAKKLDSLLARVDSCQTHLERVPQILKRFRQSVLAKAISGELTAEWRGTDTTENWSYERAEDVCEKVQSGGTPREGFIDKPGIPFLKVYNIVDQKVDFHYRPQYITKDIQKGSMSKSQTKPNDVLMNIVGPPLGKVAIVPDEFSEWNVNQAITLFRPSERIISKWIYYFLCSGYSIATIVHETRGMVGQTNISLSQCRNFVFPVPSLEEQAEIVRRVEKLFAYAERLEARYTSASEHVERLTPSLLAKAFRGELVGQVEGDESAQELLERIRKARKDG